jgi:hypothetical protein
MAERLTILPDSRSDDIPREQRTIQSPCFRQFTAPRTQSVTDASYQARHNVQGKSKSDHESNKNPSWNRF